MKITYYILAAFFLLACKQTNQDTTISTEATTQVKKAVQPTAAKEIISAKSEPRIVDNEPTAEFPFNVMLKDVDGNLKNSNEIFKSNGKPTVLLFWLTTCGPCHQKLNAIKPLYPEWIKEADFNVYAISGDFSKNFPKFVTQTKSKNWEWETYNDVNRGFRKILPGGLNGYPQTFIFDKDGKLVYQDKKYKRGDEVKLFETIKGICKA